MLSTPTPSGLTPRTMISDPVIVTLGGSGAVVSDSKSRRPLPSKLAPSAGPMENPRSRTVAERPASRASRVDGTAGQSEHQRECRRLREIKLRPRRRTRVRLRYLMQAWGVSLVVHVVILSALAAATFTSPDTIKKIINFDSALASYSNGEPEVLPIYADPDNAPRDRAIGDEHAATPGEAAPVVLSEGGSESEGEESGGMIVAGGVGSGRPSNTPRVRGVGKGRINEGSSLPGVKIDGLGGSPLTLLTGRARRRFERRWQNRRRPDLRRQGNWCGPRPTGPRDPPPSERPQADRRLALR